MNKRNDFFIVGIVGFLIGIFSIIPLKNIITFNFSYIHYVFIILGCSIFAVVALFVLKLIGKKIPVFEKFGKFAAIGTLNTIIDLSILNILTVLSGFSSGFLFFLFKACSFSFATTNSYFWNKFWTFQSKAPASIKEYLRFGFFTLIGAAINASVALFVVYIIGDTLSSNIRTNVAALVAVGVSFIFNFLSYSKIVFPEDKKKPSF